MKRLLLCLVAFGAVAALLIWLAPRVDLAVGPAGLVGTALALAFLTWALWQPFVARPVSWPKLPDSQSRAGASDWAFETLLANALRGSSRSTRDLGLILQSAAGDKAVSPELNRFIQAAVAGETPRINRRQLRAYLKEIAQ